MTESDENSEIEAAPSGAEEQTTFTDELKSGLAVLLHVQVGKLESASIQLIDRTGRKLVIKTDHREGWCSWCSCLNRRYEIVPGQLEPVSVRVHTSKLSRSVARVNGDDPHLIGRVLERSLSLIRRYPSSESIDITFATAEMEERFRTWVHRTMTITPPKKTPSRRRVVRALEGKSPLPDSDTETAFSEDRQTPKPPLPFDAEIGGGSAAVHPAPRRDSLKPLKAPPAERSSGGVGRRGSASSSGGVGRRGSASSSGGFGRRGSASSVGSGGGLAISVASVSSARSVESIASSDESDDDQAPLTWKEPPVVRRMSSSSSSSGKGRRQALSRGTGVSPASAKPLDPERPAAAAAAATATAAATAAAAAAAGSFPDYPEISPEEGGSPPPGPEAGAEDEVPAAAAAAAAPRASSSSPEVQEAKKSSKKKKKKKKK